MDLVERAKKIITQPTLEWPVIAVEPTTVGDLYRGYIIPLAAIPAVASFIGLSLVGMRMPIVGTIRVPFFSGLAHAVLRFVLSLAGVYVVALIINALAPSFAGERDRIQALKVAAYSSTAGWLAGVFLIFPWFGSFVGFLAALYGFYLLYVGLPLLMRTPREKSFLYIVAVVVAAIAVSILISVAVGLVIGRPGMHGRMSPMAVATAATAGVLGV